MSHFQAMNASAHPEYQHDENMKSIEGVFVYGMDPRTTDGLLRSYWGGRWSGFAVAKFDLTLTNNADNYVVVLRSSGVASVSTATTNWSNTGTYARVEKITTASGVYDEDSDVENHRMGLYGVHGQGQASNAAEFKGLTFTSDTGSTADTDPGNGLFKWNNATQASATVLYFDNQTADGVSLTTLWGNLGASGFIHLQQSDDASKWQLWRWTAAPVDGTGYRKFTSTLQASGGSLADDKTVYATFTNDRSSTGRHSVWVSASAMRPSSTGGCAALAVIASAANQPDIATLDFDPSTQEYAQLSIAMPKSWNEGTVTFKPIWSHPATASNFGVVFDLQGVALSDDDAIAQAFGTAQTSTDTGGTTDDIYVGPESSAITIGGSPAAEDIVHFRLSRVTGNGSDTMAVDARLHGIILYITTDAENDA